MYGCKFRTSLEVIQHRLLTLYCEYSRIISGAKLELDVYRELREALIRSGYSAVIAEKIIIWYSSQP